VSHRGLRSLLVELDPNDVQSHLLIPVTDHLACFFCSTRLGRDQWKRNCLSLHGSGLLASDMRVRTVNYMTNTFTLLCWPTSDIIVLGGLNLKHLSNEGGS
jgi:hypothetical protein